MVFNSWLIGNLVLDVTKARVDISHRVAVVLDLASTIAFIVC
jgi:hypothetical protein